MGFDLNRNKTVLFGGLSAGILNDSFSFDGATRLWDTCKGSDGVTLCGGLEDPRARHRMEWNPEGTGALQLFGGNGAVFYNDLFRLPDNSAWEGPAPVTGAKPEGRCCVAFAYDTFNDHMFMAGGGYGTGMTTALPDAFTWIAPRWRCISQLATCDGEDP